ncbi:MAG: aspartate:alanine exchanger family transporter [Bacteroidales bacterium]
MQSILHEGYFVLFVIISLGLILGNLRIKGFSLDSSAVIFIALLMGHLGFSIPSEFQTLGIVLFIFTIGIQAGPGFIDAALRYGRQLAVIGTILIAVAAGITYLAIIIFDISVPVGVGLFNGALTSTPGLAAAFEATGSPLTAVGYGIAYPAGVIGVILFVQLYPKLARKDLQKEEREYIRQMQEGNPKLQNVVLKVTNANVHGKTIRELDLRKMTQAVISRVKSNENIFSPTVNTILHLNDFVKVVGDEEALQKAALLIGEVADEELTFDERFTVNWLLVTNSKVINKTIHELNLTALNATITRIRRSGIDLKPFPHSKLRFGDKLLISGSNQEMPEVRRLLGNDEKKLSETNFLPIALGIVIGVLLGSISIPVFGLFDFRLGLTGGVLAAALVLSNIGKTGPILWSMTGSANQLLRRLGLLIFMASVGTSAGSELGSVLSDNGLQLIAIGIVITVLPMFVGAFIGQYVFKLNFITLLGVIAGAMTSTPGLAAIDSKIESDAASVGYATVYPIALVLMIIFSQLLALMM